MIERRLGPFMVSAIGFGCMGFSHAYGTPPDREGARAVLLQALDLGHTHFDTAAIYGLGHNETLVGEVLGPHRARFTLASKCGMGPDATGQRGLDGRPASLIATCERSLRQLGTDVIDLYYLHRWDRRVPIEECVGALGDLVRQGKLRAIGLSEVSAATLRRAHAVHPIAALQSEYSPWTRNPEIATLAACKELGVTFVSFSPVGRGFLAGGMPDPAALEKQDIRAPMPRFLGENYRANLALRDRFNAIAAEAGCTPAQLCLAWVLSRGDHVVTIPGTVRSDHLVENWQAGALALSPAILARVDALMTPTAPHGHRYSDAMRATVDTEEF